MDTSHHDDDKIARIFGASPTTTTDNLALAKLAMEQVRVPRDASSPLDFDHLTDRTRLFARTADGSCGCSLGRGLP